MFPRGRSVLLSAIVGMLTRRSRPHSPSRSVLLRHTLPLLALLSLLPFSAHAVFTTPGSFDVGPDGSAGYTIPIQVPPGTAGMAPKLSLGYNSNGGNGVLGMGWSLEGLSQIGRCPKTMAQDGTRGGVNLDNNDRYCLDGQRLISTGGTYGADGTEYRTELANFAKIVSYGVAGNGPAWFKVWAKGGQIIEYGNTADSRIEAQSKTTVLSWGVNKIADTKGNYFTVSYTEDNANGETLVSRIDYTGNATSSPTLTPYASVQFTYETRPDPSTAYLAGSVIKSTKRMTKVQTYLGTSLIKEVRLAFDNGGARGRTRLVSITECDSGGSCFAPITASYRNPGGTFQSDTAIGLRTASYNSNDLHFQMGDVNGDGLPDLVYDANGTADIRVLLNTGNGFGTDTVWGTRQEAINTNAGGMRVVDVNSDGKADLMYDSQTNGSYIRVMLSDGSKFVGDVAWGRRTESYNSNGGGWKIDDVNGDGLPDVIYDSSTNGGYVRALLNNGTSFGQDTTWGLRTGSYNDNDLGFQLADMTGDGLPDLVYDASGADPAMRVLVNKGNGFDTDTLWGYRVASINTNAGGFRAVDINGDGLADIVYDSSTLGAYVRVMLSNGKTLLADTAWGLRTGSYNDNNLGFQLADMTGDGLPDLVYDGGGAATSAIRMLANTGNGFNTDTLWGSRIAAINTNAGGFQLPDIDGDGVADLIYDSVDLGAYVRKLKSSTPYPDLLISISNGLGVVTAPGYKPITDPSVYTKDTGSQSASYPIQDLQSPMYVVSSVSTADGLGGNLVTNYTYGGAKVDLSGRGFLGFRWTKAASPDTNLDLTTYYRQDFPYIGLPLQSEKRTTAGILLSTVSNTYANTPLSTGSAISQFPYVNQTQEQNYELDGSLVTSTTTGYQYDDYGNATQVTVNSNDGFIKTTANLYANDVPNWLLGRLLRSSVTTTAP